MDSDQARKNFRTILQGKSPRHELSLAEAKARLRAVDPEIDISRPLQHLHHGEAAQAALTLAAETVTSVSLPYIRPLVTSLVYGLLLSGRKRQLTR